MREPSRWWLAVYALLHAAVVTILATALPAAAQSEPENPSCPLRVEHYGPFDYRNERDKLAVVEKYHFTPRVEALMRGESGYLGDDLAYTLKASPNHHRALVALVRFWERTKQNPPPNMGWTVDCFFFRGIRFRPDDHILRAIYAQYLGKQGRTAEALQQLDVATQRAGDNPLAQYNIGLVYMDLKQYDKALAQAHLARKQGYPRQELEDLLRKAGAWKDPQE